MYVAVSAAHRLMTLDTDPSKELLEDTLLVNSEIAIARKLNRFTG